MFDVLDGMIVSSLLETEEVWGTEDEVEGIWLGSGNVVDSSTKTEEGTSVPKSKKAKKEESGTCIGRTSWSNNDFSKSREWGSVA